MSRRPVIALLGQRDSPTDAVEEYCCYLGEALQPQDFEMSIERVAWADCGWRSALRSLQRRAKLWRGMWVLVQYTALAWSSRGFPVRFVRVLQTLKSAGAFVGVVFHDVEPYGGTRIIDRLRRRSQLQTMGEALRLSDAAIFTVPIEKISWLRPQVQNVCFIPVGANLPIRGKANSGKEASTEGKLTIAIFGVTAGKAGRREIREITEAVQFVASRGKELRLLVLGRNSQAAEAQLQAALGNSGVELHVLGVLPSEEVVRNLSNADVLLFVRGPISSRRSSAIAGIACGLPVIARAGPETAPPVTEAGVAFYSESQKDEPGVTLARVLEDELYRAKLTEKGCRAYEEHFSWSAIATRFAQALTQYQ
jgi:glycosyltransferase involved in cell wall biosynthesis